MWNGRSTGARVRVTRVAGAGGWGSRVETRERASRRGEQRAATDQSLERGADPVVVEQHVFGEEPDRDEAALQRGEIASSIALERPPVAMESFAVALHDEPPVDQEVHSTDAVDGDLEFDMASDAPEEKSDQGLDAGFAPSIQQPPYHAEATGEPSEDIRDAAFIDETEVPCAVERGDSGAGCLTPDRLDERLHQVGDGALVGRRGGPPVIAHVFRGRGTSTGMRVLLDVQTGSTMDEDPERLQKTDAVETPAEARGLDHLGVRAG